VEDLLRFGMVDVGSTAASTSKYHLINKGISSVDVDDVDEADKNQNK
jgi:hypothetical protein